jgi:hypothetical protein
VKTDELLKLLKGSLFEGVVQRAEQGRLRGGEYPPLGERRHRDPVWDRADVLAICARWRAAIAAAIAELKPDYGTCRRWMAGFASSLDKRGMPRIRIAEILGRTRFPETRAIRWVARLLQTAECFGEEPAERRPGGPRLAKVGGQRQKIKRVSVEQIVDKIAETWAKLKRHS